MFLFMCQFACRQSPFVWGKCIYKSTAHFYLANLIFPLRFKIYLLIILESGTLCFDLIHSPFPHWYLNHPHFLSHSIFSTIKASCVDQIFLNKSASSGVLFTHQSLQSLKKTVYFFHLLKYVIKSFECFFFLMVSPCQMLFEMFILFIYF